MPTKSIIHARCPSQSAPSPTVFGQMKIALKNIFNIAVASPGQHRDNTELRMCRVDLLTHWLHTTTWLMEFSIEYWASISYIKYISSSPAAMRLNKTKSLHRKWLVISFLFHPLKSHYRERCTAPSLAVQTVQMTQNQWLPSGTDFYFQFTKCKVLLTFFSWWKIQWKSVWF